MADVSLSPGTIAKSWTVIKKIGAGSFGEVYLCRNGKGTRAALKAALSDPSSLQKECEILHTMNNLRRQGIGCIGSKHFCRCLDYGRALHYDETTHQEMDFDFFVMTLTGRGLNRLVRKVDGGCFSPGTAIGLSIQLLSALQALHSVGYLHLDVKPSNAAIGRPQTKERRLLYLLDLGLAHRFVEDNSETPTRQRKLGFRGTLMYAPNAAHSKRDYTRMDDIESWFYVMVHLYTGSLPWSHLKGKPQIGVLKHRRLLTSTRQQAKEDLLRGCPAVFDTILDHIDDLDFRELPDYEMMDQSLRTYLTDNGIKEHPYDWEEMDQESGSGDATDDEYSTVDNEPNASSSSTTTELSDAATTSDVHTQ